MEGRLTLAQHRELLVARGWLSLLMAALEFDLGDREAAEISRDAALSLGREADHPEITAWAFETPAWFALADRRLRDAVDLARAGQEVAPADRSVIVATTLQEARAWARLGARREAEHAIRRAQATLARLPEPTNPQDHFVFDPPKVSFYLATCYVWLHEPARAEEHARYVIKENGGWSLQLYPHPQGRPCGRPEGGLRPGSDTTVTGTGPTAPLALAWIHRGTVRGAVLALIGEAVAWLAARVGWLGGAGWVGDPAASR